MATKRQHGRHRWGHRPYTSWLPGAVLAVMVAVSEPGCAGDPLARARMELARGDAVAAEAHLRARLEAAPDDVEARRYLVRALGALGRSGPATAAAAELAARLPPDDPRPWLDLGAALELAHEFEGALAAYDRATEVAPSDPRGPRTGGLRAARWGRVDTAAVRLAEAVRRDPEDGEAWHALGLVRVQLGDLAGAEAAYRQGVERAPERLDNRLGLATLALRRDRPAEALRHFDVIVRGRPRHSAARLGQAYCLLRLGRLEGAAAAIEAAERLGGDPGVVARQRALLEHLRGPRRHGPPTSRAGHDPPAGPPR